MASPTYKTGHYSKDLFLVAAMLGRALDPRRIRVVYVPVEVPPVKPPLTREQQTALVLLNTGQTISGTARLLRLPRQTIQSWVYRSAQMQAGLTHPDLLDRIATRRERALTEVLTQLCAAVSAPVDDTPSPGTTAPAPGGGGEANPRRERQ
jgi:hypothetical protein